MLSEADRSAKLRIFARGRPGVREVCLGPVTGFAPRFLPMISAQIVRNANDPVDGYVTIADAHEAAKRYRDACRKALDDIAGRAALEE